MDAADAAVDAPVDVMLPARSRAGLIGLWELDEVTGTTIADTSDAAAKVPLAVTTGTVTFAAGTLTAVVEPTVIESAGNTHLNKDIEISKAVSLEVWALPAAADQGSLADPVVLAGLSSSAFRRNISIMQAGTRWLARVRSSLDENGGPDLVSAVEVRAGAMTHLVVVSDATQRILYVDGRQVARTESPRPPTNWDTGYRMQLGNERTHNAQWSGTFALLAMYDRALSQELVETQLRAGPGGR